MLEKLQWFLIVVLVIVGIVLGVMLSNVQKKVDAMSKWQDATSAWLLSEPPLVRGRFQALCHEIETAHPNMFPKCGGPVTEPPKDGPPK